MDELDFLVKSDKVLPANLWAAIALKMSAKLFESEHNKCCLRWTRDEIIGRADALVKAYQDKFKE